MKIAERKDLMSFAKLYSPLILAGIVLLLMHAFLDSATFTKLTGFMALYIIPPFGKESIIPLGIYFGLNPLLLAGSLFFVDFFVGLGFYTSFDFFKRSKLVGKYVRWVEERGQAVLGGHTWVRRLVVLGLVLWMIIPFQGTGAITTSLIGRLIGVSKGKVFAAVLIGSAVGCAIVTYLTLALVRLGGYETALWAALAVIVITVVAQLLRFWRKKS